MKTYLQLPGMLVEYLVIGSGALFWLLILVHLPGMDFPALFNADDVSVVFLILLIPSLYVLGMLMDFVGRSLTYMIESLVVKPVTNLLDGKLSIIKAKEQEYEINEDINVPLSRYYSRVDIILQSPELAKQLEMRFSRHRIARGTFGNAVLIFVMLILYYTEVDTTMGGGEWVIFIVVGISILAALYTMWYRYRTLSKNWRQKILLTLKEKELIS